MAAAHQKKVVVEGMKWEEEEGRRVRGCLRTSGSESEMKWEELKSWEEPRA